MTIAEIQEEIVDEFSIFDDWMQRYEYMIELGKSLPLIEDQYKTEDNIIKGCQSKVWVHAEMNDDKVEFTADSDAIITKGIIAILIRVFSNQHPKDIIEANTDFIDKIGLKADEILYIGDSLKLDIIPALEVGFEVCLIDRDAYYKQSKYRINSFKDLILKLKCSE